MFWGVMPPINPPGLLISRRPRVLLNHDRTVYPVIRMAQGIHEGFPKNNLGVPAVFKMKHPVVDGRNGIFCHDPVGDF